MDFSMLLQAVPILQIIVIVSFALGILSLLFLGIRIRFMKKSLKRWMNQSRRLSQDPTLDHIIKTYKIYKDKNSERTNTQAVIKVNYYKQKIFFIPIYYWEQFISKSEILCLFIGLLGTFILVSEKMDNPFIPLILGTCLFIILVGLETILALNERRNIIFVELEEYLDNHFSSTLQPSYATTELFKDGKIKPINIYDEKQKGNSVDYDINDKEIEWIINQFHTEEKEV